MVHSELGAPGSWDSCCLARLLFVQRCFRCSVPVCTLHRDQLRLTAAQRHDLAQTLHSFMSLPWPALLFMGLGTTALTL